MNFWTYYFKNSWILFGFLVALIILIIAVIKDQWMWYSVGFILTIMLGSIVGTWFQYKRNKKWINND